MLREFGTGSLLAAIAALALGNTMAISALFTRPALSVLPGGKGTATLFASSAGRVLVDAGSDASILRALGATLLPWERHIDAVILTSSKGNGGLSAVAARYTVSRVLHSGTDIPYGSRIALGNSALIVVAPGRYRFGSFAISSTTPPGTYEMVSAE